MNTTHSEDFYKLLEVRSEATAEEIRRAYREKVRVLHPDLLRGKGISEEVVRLAEEQLKAVNRAYQVLGDIRNRAEFDEQFRRRTTLPRPVVEPPYLGFDDVTPGVKQTASFIVRNVGGPYTKITINKSALWITDIRWGSLTNSDELPLRVEIDASGPYWGTTYNETIVVRLDDQEAQVRVALRTQLAPVAATPSSSASRSSTPIAPALPSHPPAMAAPVLPWPSFGWQQVALIGAGAAGTVVFAAGLGVIANLTEFGTAMVQALATSLIGLLLASVAIYGGWSTSWLNRTKAAPLPGRIAAGTSVGVVTGAAVISAVMAVLAVAAIVLTFAVIFSVLAAASKK